MDRVTTGTDGGNPSTHPPLRIRKNGHIVKRVNRTVSAISGVLAAIGAVLLVFLMISIVADVTRRTLTDKSINGAIEIAPLILLSAVMLGMAYAEKTETHVRTSLVTSHLPIKARLIFRSVAGMLASGLLFWVAWESFSRALDAFDQKDVTPGFVAIQTWPARALVPLGFFLFALTVALRAWDDIVALRAGATEDPRHIHDDAAEAALEGIKL